MISISESLNLRKKFKRYRVTAEQAYYSLIAEKQKIRKLSVVQQCEPENQLIIHESFRLKKIIADLNSVLSYNDVGFAMFAPFLHQRILKNISKKGES